MRVCEVEREIEYVLHLIFFFFSFEFIDALLTRFFAILRELVAQALWVEGPIGNPKIINFR